MSSLEGMELLFRMTGVVNIDCSVNSVKIRDVDLVSLTWTIHVIL